MRAELVRVANRNVLLVDRFDRVDVRRVSFASALTMLEASDGDHRSYLEIAEVLETISDVPGHELEQLFRRVVFSVLTGNTDDHLRNHGFLRKGRAWTLSPAYDLNPNPYSTGVQSTSPGIDDATASVELAALRGGLLPSDLRSGQGDRRRDRVEHDTMAGRRHIIRRDCVRD